jgi:predicted secreted protein
MTWLSGIFLYLLIWWTVLFAVLPWGNVPSDAPGQPGKSMGAPANPRIRQKFIATTILAAVVWLVVFAIIQSNLISFRDLVKDMPE